MRIPPISAASISPPNILPLTPTPIAPISTIGNWPAISRPRSIFISSTVPEKLSPDTPFIPVTVADKVKTKSSGSASISAHSIPILDIFIGSQLGQTKLSAVAPPKIRKTPNPGKALKEPSPRNAKLRPSPPITTDPKATVADTDPTWSISSLSAAPVSRIMSTPLSVTNLLNFTSIVSTLNLNALT